jgi:23S rRNA pseudouridine955/2504/2580 synthase
MGTGLSLQSRNEIAVDKMLEAYLISKGLNPADGKLIHRIDRKTSGLLALAKSKEMASWLSSLFRERDDAIQKTYFALLCGIPKFSQGNIRQSSQEEQR